MKDWHTPINPQEAERRARARAIEEAERLWPASFAAERRRAIEELTIRYYRQMTGAKP